MLRAKNMVTGEFLKFNIIEICTKGNYREKLITKFYNN
jgi:hypothetical protein